MKFNFFNSKNLDIFEKQIKQLALDKDHKFRKKEETLKEEEILNHSSPKKRELLKVFNDKAKITFYHFNGRNSNYEIIIGETKFENVIGLEIKFSRKPFRQIGKLLLAGAIFSIPVGGLLMGSVFLAGSGLVVSSGVRSLQIKGPLKNDFEEIISDTLGNPITIKE
ncbi:hypothetical protein [Staphylococcus epidermidis]|uniref:hypothetical protein n=1 Tax=Staphylococcus epidermidis TaxID=1282 RepID=UPI00287F4655|nr:hypothetical protein [Staphylococcus epidermidis]